MLKTIVYNLLIFFVLVNVLYWSIPVVGTVSNLIQGKPDESGLEFRSFIGWHQPQRPTVNDGTDDSKRAYFFGGSTMFGLGLPDSQTIPSLFAAATGIHSENYGALGYTSHQSLVLLLQMLQAGHRPNLVIFYDGVNDVAVKCEQGMTPESHGEEREINSLLRGRDLPSSFTYHFRPAVRLAERINSQISGFLGVSKYDCDSNRDKAQAIADNLIRDWQFAKLLTESFGVKFVAFLQPVSYLSRTRLDHLELRPNLDRQYQAVYPSIREQIARGHQFHDLVPVLDVDEPVYTDFNHITPMGNQYVVRAMIPIAAPAAAR